MTRSLVLLSGGLDSAANLAQCAQENDEMLALTFDYGQRAAAAETHAAALLAEHFNCVHRVMDLDWLGQLAGSALTDSQLALPRMDSAQLSSPELTAKSAQAVWVPNRNGVFIAVAAAIAEREGWERIVLGFNAEEAETFPDNSSEFVDRTNAALALSTATHVRVFSHTLQMQKSQIVRMLRSLVAPFPFALLWSCYSGGKRACGHCESCLRFARAMKES